jgi:methyltransferase (TIGR00027 family)
MSSVERPASRTAWRVALHRALHQVLDRPPVLDDPMAIPILGTDTAAIVREHPSSLERGPLDAYLRAFMAARARFAEDHLEAARDAGGITQYVILGAGLDTFAYRQRRLDPPLGIWEVDRPATQHWKRARLAAAAIPVPGNVHYVPVDFEHDSLPDALAASGFDARAGAVFAWLGVTMYLTPAAIDATLGYVARVAGSGGVAFDYATDPALLPPPQREIFDRMAARVEKAGEPWITTFAPATLAERLRRLDFTATEDAGADELNARYFAGRPDGLRVGSLARMMWASVSQ